MKKFEDLPEEELKNLKFVTPKSAEIGSVAVGVAVIDESDTPYLLKPVVVTAPGEGRYDGAEALYDCKEGYPIFERKTYGAFLEAIKQGEFNFGLYPDTEDGST